MSEAELDELCHPGDKAASSGSEDARRSGVALAHTGADDYDPAWDLNYVSLSLIQAQRQAFAAERQRFQVSQSPDDPAYVVAQDQVLHRQPEPPAPPARTRKLKIRISRSRADSPQTGLAAAGVEESVQPLAATHQPQTVQFGRRHDDVVHEPLAQPVLPAPGFVGVILDGPSARPERRLRR